MNTRDEVRRAQPESIRPEVAYIPTYFSQELQKDVEVRIGTIGDGRIFSLFDICIRRYAVGKRRHITIQPRQGHTVA